MAESPARALRGGVSSTTLPWRASTLRAVAAGEAVRGSRRRQPEGVAASPLMCRPTSQTACGPGAALGSPARRPRGKLSAYLRRRRASQGLPGSTRQTGRAKGSKRRPRRTAAGSAPRSALLDQGARRLGAPNSHHRSALPHACAHASAVGSKAFLPSRPSGGRVGGAKTAARRSKGSAEVRVCSAEENTSQAAAKEGWWDRVSRPPCSCQGSHGPSSKTSGRKGQSHPDAPLPDAGRGGG